MDLGKKRIRKISFPEEDETEEVYRVPTGIPIEVPEKAPAEVDADPNRRQEQQWSLEGNNEPAGIQGTRTRT